MGCSHGKSGISSAKGVRHQLEGHVVRWRSASRHRSRGGPAGGLAYKPRSPPIDTPTALAEARVMLATDGSRDSTIAVCPGKKEKLMIARKLIARSSLLIWVIACGSLVSGAQNGGPEPKSESRYPLITCEELKRLIDSKATQDIVIVDTQPSEYFAEAHI